MRAAPFTMLFTVDTGKPSTCTIAHKCCSHSYLCILLIFISKTMEVLLQDGSHSLQMHAYHQQWHRIWLICFNRQKIGTTVYHKRQHETGEDWVAALSSLCMLHWVVHHAFQMFCISALLNVFLRKYRFTCRSYACQELQWDHHSLTIINKSHIQ
jgi:hypothetical protein